MDRQSLSIEVEATATSAVLFYPDTFVCMDTYHKDWVKLEGVCLGATSFSIAGNNYVIDRDFPIMSHLDRRVTNETFGSNPSIHQDQKKNPSLDGLSNQ